MSQGGGPQAVSQMVSNDHVYQALIALTQGEGSNFRYNEEAWRQWYVARHTPSQVDLLHRPD